MNDTEIINGILGQNFNSSHKHVHYTYNLKLWFKRENRKIYSQINIIFIFIILWLNN